uniref:Ankyrin repeat domain 46b n=1 Tax=Maylandia zebra TaxID=106582 RepID=A0A3P9DDT0_9CICH
MSYVFINDSSQTSVPLLQSCIDGDLPFAKRLLETGCDPNIRDNRGRTGLHLAAARGNVEICRLLHKFGADLLATDYQGNTALHLCGHVDTIQFLVSNGLKIDICVHSRNICESWTEPGRLASTFVIMLAFEMLQGTMYLYINAVERLPVHIVSFIY